LKSLVCSGGDNALHVLHGLSHEDASGRSRLSAAGSEAPLVKFIMGKECPASASLTDADRAALLRIEQDAIKRAGG